MWTVLSLNVTFQHFLENIATVLNSGSHKKLETWTSSKHSTQGTEQRLTSQNLSFPLWFATVTSLQDVPGGVCHLSGSVHQMMSAVYWQIWTWRGYMLISHTTVRVIQQYCLKRSVEKKKANANLARKHCTYLGSDWHQGPINFSSSMKINLQDFLRFLLLQGLKLFINCVNWKQMNSHDSLICDLPVQLVGWCFF